MPRELFEQREAILAMITLLQIIFIAYVALSMRLIYIRRKHNPTVGAATGFFASSFGAIIAWYYAAYLLKGDYGVSRTVISFVVSFLASGAGATAVGYYITSIPEGNYKAGEQERLRVWGWIFIAPWIIGFLAFYFIPIVVSLGFTFTNLDLNQPDNIGFVGLKNWKRLTTDPDVKTSLWVTLKFSGIMLPLAILLPLSLATLLNVKNLWAKRLFRTLFYMPYIVPLISVSYIFNGFLNSESGWLNKFLETYIGVNGPAWMDDSTWIYPALFMIGIWATGNAMLTMLAGMQTVPTELYEAAQIDGANRFTIWRKITLPLISPVIFYNLILALVGLFRYFEIPYMLKKGTGQPGNSTLFFNIYFYKHAFTNRDMGYGATLAWLLFIVAMTVTVFFFWTARYWVYYAGDRD